MDGRGLEALLDELADRVADRLRDVDVRPAVEVPAEWRLLNLEEAAGCLGRSTRWVRDRVKAGDLPYVRLDGGAYGFELEDLQAFAAARRVSADGPDLSASRVQAGGDRAWGNGSGGADRVGNRRVVSGERRPLLSGRGEDDLINGG